MTHRSRLTAVLVDVPKAEHQRAVTFWSAALGKEGKTYDKFPEYVVFGEATPGVEFMRSEVFSGDHGLAVIEHAPFGVIGVITPVTHSLPTITGNAVSEPPPSSSESLHARSRRRECR